MFYSFQSVSFIPLLSNLFLSIFLFWMLLEFYMFIWDCLLQMHRNKFDFENLDLGSYNLAELVYVFNIFFFFWRWWWTPWNFLYIISCHLWIELVLLSGLLFLPIALAGTSSTVLSGSGASGHPWFVSDLRGKASSLSLLVDWIFIDTLY